MWSLCLSPHVCRKQKGHHSLSLWSYIGRTGLAWICALPVPLPPLAVCVSVLFAALHGQDEGGHDADGMTGGVLLCRLGSGSAEQLVAEQLVARLDNRQNPELVLNREHGSPCTCKAKQAWFVFVWPGLIVGPLPG